MDCGQSVGAYTAIGSAEANWKIKHEDDSQLSVQYALDCKQHGRYVCGIPYSDLFAYFLLRDHAYLIDDYPSNFTGIPKNCAADDAKIEENAGPNPRFRLPILVNDYDQGMEDALQKWTLTSTVKISQSIVQFYHSGVVTAEKCATERRGLYFTVMVVGYDRTAPVPYWKVQWAFGEDWGQKGYMLIEKVNGSTNAGACEINESPAYIPPL
jgi:hypothetical protein